VEKIAGQGLTLDLTDNDHLGLLGVINLQRDEAAFSGFGQGVLDIDGVDLKRS